jgi:tetratricopeptide (TPR) repeat protein/tRNA A-37 threonylcarbamoyl transferase component Bud32
MDGDPRVRQLLEELLDSEQTPDEVCRDCPDLLPEVRRRWQRKRACDAQLDAMFPASEFSMPSGNPSAMPSSAEGPRILGYEVNEVLGRGGMGVVYKARHVRLNRTVAVKMLLTGAHASTEARKRFLREAEAVAALRHPNIIQVHDMGDQEGQPYFTMEFVEGGNLAQKLAGTPQSPREASALLATLAEAVHQAHVSGIVHRDLKPSNVLLTADGTPKIGDFGLARRIEGEAGLTGTGAAVGTPSYMAPEQAEAKSPDVGPAADTYALGAILYELLTGRPPFRAESAAETLRQVVSQDPVPPSRLNASVPRDPETICLKCLEKDPKRRYASAAALAEDLHRFQRNEPILARPVGPLERTLRWALRNPTGAALVATALALIGLASGGGVWFVRQRAERRSELRTEVGTTVVQAGSFSKRFHFREAWELLEQAQQRLQPAGPEDLRRRVDRAQADLELAENLDTARLRAATPVEGRFTPFGAGHLYEETFAKAGMSQQGDNSEAVAARVRESAVRAEIVAALDDWASITKDQARRAWLLAVARGADPDPLRDRVRMPKLWQDGARLTRLVSELQVDELSPQLSTALGRVLPKTHGEAVSLLGTAQARNPQDFWLNYEMGWALYGSHQKNEALGFFRAALALRPKASLAHNAIGLILGDLRRRDEAISHLRESIRLDPKNAALPLHNLGIAMEAQGQVDEAISHYQESIRLDPRASAAAHNNLGNVLRAMGRLDEAISHFQESIRLDPKMAAAHNNLGIALRDKGRLDEAISHWQKSIRLDSKMREPHINLGNALRAKGRLDEALTYYQEFIRLDPNSALAHYALGLALRDKGRMDEAIGHFQNSIRLDPNSALAHQDLGAAMSAKGRLDEAIGHFQNSIRLDPASAAVAHCNLGIALRGKGRPDQSIGHLQQAIQLDPNLALAHSQIYTCRYEAASAALQASAGHGSKEPRLGEQERISLRAQALDWLRANLELKTRLLKDSAAVDLSSLSGWSLSAWETDPVLFGVRDQAALLKLPDAERVQWQRLWGDVAALLAADPVQQGLAHAAHREWDKAADCYTRALTRAATDAGHLWFEYAALLLLSGNRLGYEEACAHMIAKYGNASSLRAYHVARACTLAPLAVADASLPGRLAEAELKVDSGQFWSLTEQGALHYRAGRFEQAVALFNQSLRADPQPGRAVVNWLWLALAQQRLGKSDEARRSLDQATAWLDQYRDEMPRDAEQKVGLHIHNWLEAHVLRREAEGMIRPAHPR